MRWPRCPAATISASATIRSTGRMPRRVMIQAAAMPIAETTAPVMTTVRVSAATVACTAFIDVAMTKV